MKVKAKAALALCGLTPQLAHAFCGFYVGKADSKLFNKASQVIVAREEDRTIVTMQSDYQGPLQEFALVVPVPQALQKGQVKVGDSKIFERLDAYSAPRLVEYFDPNPCDVQYFNATKSKAMQRMAPEALSKDESARALGVTVEASYSVGEYDIVILSATQSDGLATWLQQNGYRMPAKAAAALAPYVRQGMKFFVAKVNLKDQAATGLAYLRPLQFAYESEKFMLPIRLGMANAEGPQDLVIYMLTRKGRVETTNYRTIKLPANMDLPEFLKEKDQFAQFYRKFFEEQMRRENNRVVFTEYFWDMGWCDPCAADPLTSEELRQAGAFWVTKADDAPLVPTPRRKNPGIMPPGMGGGAQPVLLTRLHVRYAPDTFPEDLFFQETEDQANFQARYVLRHAWTGSDNCEAATAYRNDLKKRREDEAQRLATLTATDINEIRKKMSLPPAKDKPWWQNIMGK